MTSDRFLLMFTPTRWSPARRFALFLSPPFPARGLLPKAASATENRRQKLEILASLANELRPGLLADSEELEQEGFSSGTRSKKYAAVVESLVLESYSLLDAVRGAIFAVHRSVSGVQNSSTDKLFRRAHHREYGPEFPERLYAILGSAYSDWFPELRGLRVELSHGDIGSCHIDKSTDRVVYMHRALGTTSRALVIHDLEEKVSRLTTSARNLSDDVFSFFCSRLEPIEKQLPCGIYRGRAYERLVAHSEDLDFNAGKCFSKRWFERETEHLCPLRHGCGAYLR